MQNYLDSVDLEWFNNRLIGVLVVVLAAFAVLLARLLYLQVIEGKELRRLSEINSIRLQDLPAPRGLIFDRKGRMLVDNRPSFDLYIVLKDARPLDATLKKLSRFVNETPEALNTRIQNAKKKGAYKPILLKEDIGRDVLATVEVHKFELPGVVVTVSPRRHYLYHEHAVHLLGYMGEINAEELQCDPYSDCKVGDFIGKFGVEKSYDDILRGKRGGRQVEVNATGQIISILDTVNPLPGRNITLSIDFELQEKAEALLEGNAGALVAVDPNTGSILAMASWPAFDPNLFVSGMSREQWQGLITNPFRPMENKAVQAEYPPASTYKIITAIAGLEEGVIDETTTFFCPGYYKYGNRVYRCWRRAGHGDVNVVKALAQSCDVFFYQVGEAVGVDKLAWYATKCGLGSTTGIGLDGEERGLVPTAAWKRKRIGVSWQGGETLSIAIGQGYNLVTPLQMAMVAAAVGNGGTRYKPMLVKSIEDVEQKEITENRPVVIGTLPVSAKTLELVHLGLWEVVNDIRGTAWATRLPGIQFSGKTGTAQVVSLRAEGSQEGGEKVTLPKDHAWFVAYGPSTEPKIAVAVIVEHGEHGSSAAAPIASELIKTYLEPTASKPTSMSMAVLQNGEHHEHGRAGRPPTGSVSGDEPSTDGAASTGEGDAH